MTSDDDPLDDDDSLPDQSRAVESRRSSLSIYPSVEVESAIRAASNSTGKPMNRIVCEILEDHFSQKS